MKENKNQPKEKVYRIFSVNKNSLIYEYVHPKWLVENSFKKILSKKEKDILSNMPEDAKVYCSMSDLISLFCNTFHFSVISIMLTHDGYYLITTIKD